MKPRVVVADYGMGNLRSVAKALERAGAEVLVTGESAAIASAERLVLPGVGACGAAMENLRARNLVEPILAHLAADRPFLGICLGLQLLFESSEEGEVAKGPSGPVPVEGLGFFRGRVVRFPDPPAGRERAWKVPHIGWNDVRRGPAAAAASPVLEGTADGTHFYFVHSFYPAPADRSLVALEAEYAGLRFCAAVAKGRLFASQFHPEKSQAAGLWILGRFVRE